MSTVTISYAAATAITCSIASKTTTQGRRSAAIDNSSLKYVDALVTIGVLVGTIAAPASIALYAYASADDGTNFETGGSTDADWNNIRGDELLIRSIFGGTSTTTFWGVGTVAWKYNGIMPRNWGIIISQIGCGTLSATEGSHTKKYQGISYLIT